MIRKKTITKEAALLRMADLCARGEHCTSEIKEKLRKMMIPSDQATEIIEYLEENRYIENQRYANAFARDKVRFSGWGRHKIRMALMLKKISASEIAEALENIEENDYQEAITRVATAKARSLDLKEYDDRTKLYRHLASKGFESARISKIIKELTTNH